MPNRILRDGFITSRRITRMSFAARYLWFCLVGRVDDYGRYEADIDTLRGVCLPHDLEEISDERLRELLAECTSTEGLRPGEKPLVQIYEVDGKAYLQLDNFGQRVRSNTSKYPAPPPVDRNPRADVSQPRADGGHPTAKTETKAKAECADDFADRMYNRHPKLQNRPLVEMACARLLAEGGRELLERVERVHQGWCESPEWKREGGAYVVTLDKWLNDRAWMREASKPAPVRTMPVIRTPWLEERA